MENQNRVLERHLAAGIINCPDTGNDFSATGLMAAE
jgi:hypothetical protein